MRSSTVLSLLLACVLFPAAALAQGQVAVQAPDGPPDMGPPGMMTGKRVVIRREMGKWWQDSAVAKKLGLTEKQISQLNQIFYDHRLKLIDDNAAMEKADLRLQNLLDEDEPSEKQVSAQVDQVLTARGALEREYTMMGLDLRKVLTVAQWRLLKSIRNEHGPRDHIFFYRKFSPGDPPPGAVAIPDPPPPPGPGGDDMD